METGEILERLRRSGSMPLEAIRAAASARETVIPALVAEIERCAARASAALESAPRESTPGEGAPHEEEDWAGADEEEATFVFSAFHLLGSLHATEAYAPLARLLRLPEEPLSWLLGDATTATAPRVMAAVFDGDPAPLYDVIEDPEADEFVRAGMCETLVIAVLENRLAREEAAAFFRATFERLQPRSRHFVWHGWQSAVAALGLVDQVPRVRDAFRRGWIDKRVLRMRDFEEDLALWRKGRAAVEERLGVEFTPFGDFVEEMADWPLYSEAAADPGLDDHGPDAESRGYYDDGETIDPAWAAPGAPAHNPWRHLSRNDPCPCGSGKKFKRCCMA